MGTGDCPGRDVASSPGPNPDGAKCNAAFNGFTAVCWNGNCTYKNVVTASCTGGANPGRIYTCVGGSAPPAQPRGAVVNLALHKPATQSSVYRGTGIDQGPQFGNDGILESKPRDPYLVVMTEADNPPWWQVDLQGNYTLTQLKLYNRKACCQERAKTVQILLSADGTHWDEAYAHNGKPFDVLTVDLTGRTARYVRVQLAERVSLHFQECEVYGYADAPPIVPHAALPAATTPSQNALQVSISPAQQEIAESGEKVSTVASVTGGVPPYSYEWYNGTQKSKVTGGGVEWSNMRRLGDRDIKVIVKDAAGKSAEAHARITVRAAGESAASSGSTSHPSTSPAWPYSSVTANIAGTWQPGARGETWIFRALGNNLYEAVGNGSSNAAGIATVIGNRFRLDYAWQDGGKHWGYYQMEIDPGGSKAAGRFHDDRPQDGTVSMTRTAGP